MPHDTAARHLTLLHRERGDALAEDRQDREMLRFIARFRFVDVPALSHRTGTSRQQVRARVRRLEQAGLVRHTGQRGEARSWTISATKAGAIASGFEPRQAPRTDVQRDHELALAWLATELERRGATTMTERECRQAERTGAARYSADLLERDGRLARRWPDLVVAHADGRNTALEFERTLKGTARLRRILEGYAAATWFREVRFLAGDATTAATLARVIATTPAPAGAPAISVAAWPGSEGAAREEIEHAISRARERAR